jgi:hypothetical protein
MSAARRVTTHCWPEGGSEAAAPSLRSLTFESGRSIRMRPSPATARPMRTRLRGSPDNDHHAESNVSGASALKAVTCMRRRIMSGQPSLREGKADQSPPAD